MGKFTQYMSSSKRTVTYYNAFTAKSGAQSLTFKSVTNRQTNRQTRTQLNSKTQRNPSPTKLATIIEDLEHVLAPKRARDTPLRLYSTFWSNLSKNFSFWVLRPCCTDGGEIWHGPLLRAKFHPQVKFGMVPSSVPNFTPIGATCRPCVRKTSKSASE